MGDMVTKSAVQRLQDALLLMPQVDIETFHTFLPGVYERKIVIPPWTVLTGAAHKTAYRVRLESGTIAVNTDDGVSVLTGPVEFYVSSGAQRAGRVFDDPVVWVDIYQNPDNITDILALEEMLYEIPECGLASSRTAEQRARVDFAAFLHQAGISQPALDEIVNTDDETIETELPGIERKKSKIHGIGMFATRSFSKGDAVCPGRVSGRRTLAGRWINHSVDANIEPVSFDGDIFAVAKTDIHQGDELLVDYRASMRVNFGIAMKGELPCLDG